MLHRFARVLSWSFVLRLLLLLELVFALVVVLVFFPYGINRLGSLALCTINALYTTFTKSTLVDLHNSVKLLVINIVTLVLDTFFQVRYHLHVVSFLLMFILHLEIFQCFVEFLVLGA